VSEHTQLEDRLRTAVHAHAAGVQADDRSLDTIRTRVRAAKRRRRAVLAGAGIAAAVAVAVAVPRLGDEGRTNISNEPGPTITVEPPPTTNAPDQSAPGQSSTTDAPPPPAAALDQAMWPDPAGSDRYADPVDAARSFVEGFLGVAAPPLSEFRAGEPGAGEIDVFARNENGQASERVATTLSLRQLDGDSWWVTAATSSNVEIESPEPLADVSSPLRVGGRASGFEGTVVVQVRDRSGSYGELGGGNDIAGSTEALEPFSVDVAFDRPTGSHVILVASTDSGVAGGLSDTTAFPVRFSADSSDPAAAGTNGDTGEFAYPPLWPFSSQAEVDVWRQQHAAQGSQPWHLDADATALAFTTGYLGFGEIDQVVASDVRDREAWVSVGYDSGSGPSTAAVIHLVRFGPGDDAPWEVVGTRDTDLTLETPSYGSDVSSTVTVGGRITGVDESLRVQVRQASSEAPIGEKCCLPAGGEGTPWQTTVSFSGATDPALTIVVSTGGHVQGVERFAITAVRP
jgi:Immunoglobulin-like domain of bacterial spore germination